MPATTAASASHRRSARLRREYLYRKSLASTESSSYEVKRRIRDALSQGKALPTELRASYDKYKQDIDAEDTKHTTNFSHVDDEYGNAGHTDPRICVTTSRSPSSRLKQFAKEMKIVIPNSTRINRGAHRVDELVSVCKESDFTDLVVLQETRGEPDGMIVCHLPLGPTAYFTLNGGVLRHDLEGGSAPMSEAYPHVIINNMHNTPLGKRVGNILKCLFPIPKVDTKRVVTFSNDGNDHISFRHHVYSKKTNSGANNTIDAVTLFEVGPRFEMRLYQIKLGTLDMKDADNEYVLKPYMNTASKRTVL